MIREKINRPIETVAKRLFWWKTPEEALRDETRFLAQVMALGTLDDVLAAQKEYPEEAWKKALRNAPPGVMDARSWHFWHYRFGMTPVPSLPVREFMKDVPEGNP